MRIFICLAFIYLLFFQATPGWSVDRIEHLKSRVKRGVNYYRDGRFTISRLTKRGLSERRTVIRGNLTNDTNKRAVSVQLEITCYNAAGDFLGSKLVDVNYLDSRNTQTFEVRFRENAAEITLFEAVVLDAIWDDF